MYFFPAVDETRLKLGEILNELKFDTLFSHWQEEEGGKRVLIWPDVNRDRTYFLSFVNR